MKKSFKFFLFLLFFLTSVFLFSCGLAKADEPEYEDTEDSPYDLSLESISVVPKSPAVDQNCIVTVKIKNNSSKSLDTNLGISSFEKSFPGFSHKKTTVPAITVDHKLAAGDYTYYIYEGSFVDAGSRTLSFYVDPDNIFYENNESNNKKTASVNVAPADSLDISVSEINLSKDTILAQESVDITVKVKNIGQVSLLSRVGLYADQSSYFLRDIDDIFPKFQVSSFEHSEYPSQENPLEPGEVFTYTYHGSFSGPGELGLVFSVDTNQELEEINESNNILTKNINVYLTQAEADDFTIDMPKVSLISSSSVQIFWETSRATDGSVQYKSVSFGDYDSYQTSFSISNWPSDKNKSEHKITIKGLNPGTRYNYKVYSQNGSVTKSREQYSFTTPANDELSFSQAVGRAMSGKSVSFEWSTDLLSSSYIYYRLSGENDFKKVGSSDLINVHSVVIDNLDDGIYEYYAESISTLDDSLKSNIKTFVINTSDLIPPESNNSAQPNDDKGVETAQSVMEIHNQSMYGDLKGKIILKVEASGEAYYVNPSSQNMYYLGRPDDAFNVMRGQGVGITNANLEKIQIGLGSLTGQDSDGDGLSDLFEDAIGTDKNNIDSDSDGNDDKTELENNYDPNRSGKLYFDNNFTNAQIGKIFIQVENNGEAWYINPTDGKRYFLGRPNDAFQVMRNLGLGISNSNFDNL